MSTPPFGVSLPPGRTSDVPASLLAREGLSAAAQALPVCTLGPATATAGPSPLLAPGVLFKPRAPRVTGLVYWSGQNLTGSQHPGDPLLEGKGGESDSRTIFMQLLRLRQLGPFLSPTNLFHPPGSTSGFSGISHPTGPFMGKVPPRPGWLHHPSSFP